MKSGTGISSFDISNSSFDIRRSIFCGCCLRSDKLLNLCEVVFQRLI